MRKAMRRLRSRLTGREATLEEIGFHGEVCVRYALARDGGASEWLPLACFDPISETDYLQLVILRVLAEAGRPTAPSEIAAVLELQEARTTSLTDTMSAMHAERMLRMLGRPGLVVPDEEGARWRITLAGRQYLTDPSSLRSPRELLS